MDNRKSLYRVAEAGLLAVILVFSANGQPAAPNQPGNELRFSSVNDNFLPPFRDRYFTNGLGIEYGHVLNPGVLFPEEVKAIFRFRVAQEIYTPRNIAETDPSRFDRPYAGYLFVRPTLHSFWPAKTALQLALDLGVIGPLAGGETIQQWWHKLIRIIPPQGWQHQIRNEVVINLNAQYLKAWRLVPAADLIFTSKLRVGTAFNHTGTGFAARFGKINEISPSAVTRSRIGSTRYLPASSVILTREWFLLLGIENTFVLHNTLIGGSLFRPSSDLHTQETKAWVLTTKTGLVYASSAITWKVVMYRLSPEVVRGKDHRYASIEIAVRF